MAHDARTRLNAELAHQYGAQTERATAAGRNSLTEELDEEAAPADHLAGDTVAETAEAEHADHLSSDTVSEHADPLASDTVAEKATSDESTGSR